MSRAVVLLLGFAVATYQSTADGQLLRSLFADDGVGGDNFGEAVALSSNYAVAGARLHDTPAFGGGAVYVFDTSTGTQLNKLQPMGLAANDSFGRAVAIDGTNVLATSGVEEAFVFNAVSGGQLQRFAPLDVGGSNLFGDSAAIEGNFAVVGDPGRSLDVLGSAGAAYVFNVNDGSQRFKLQASDADVLSGLGQSVAIDDGVIMAGAPGDSEAEMFAGLSTYSMPPLGRNSPN